MYPHERSLVEEMEGAPFALIGVNSDEVARARAAVTKHRLNWRSFRNERTSGPSISDEWCVSNWPTIVVLDSDRKIRYRGSDGHAATTVARRLVEAMTNGR